MQMATKYLWLSSEIEVADLGLAAEISEYIENNLSQDLSVNVLCRKFHISKNKLYNLFDKKYSRTINQFITDQRIVKAKSLLTTTDYQINEISCIVGIEDYNYFTKVLKKIVGETPRSYRKHFPFNI